MNYKDTLLDKIILVISLFSLIPLIWLVLGLQRSFNTHQGHNSPYFFKRLQGVLIILLNFNLLSLCFNSFLREIVLLILIKVTIKNSVACMHRREFYQGGLAGNPLQQSAAGKLATLAGWENNQLTPIRLPHKKMSEHLTRYSYRGDRF